MKKKTTVSKRRAAAIKAAEAQTQTAAAEAKEVQSFDDIEPIKGTSGKKSTSRPM